MVCQETQYELNVVINTTLGDPQPAALQSEFERAARESAAILSRTMSALSSTHESEGPVDLAWVMRHRTRLLAYAREVSRAHGVRDSFGRWFRPLTTSDLGCQHRLTIP
jgi:hypothetical protein